MAFAAERPEALAIEIAPLGDAEGGVAVRISFSIDPALGIPVEQEVVLQGSILSREQVVRNFRRPLGAEERVRYEIVQVVPAGPVTVEARLMSVREGDPLIVAKTAVTREVAAVGTPYVAGEEATADAILAEGIVPEAAGAVRIRPPSRDVAPNLFLVEVDVEKPVRRVEFWVDGTKILTRNAPPYRAELDLGAIPQRVEVRAVGYDVRGHYIDADAWVVNERTNQLEVNVTRTETPDGVSHFNVNVQNPKKVALRSVELHANDERLIAWGAPPYALDIPTARLAGKDFVTVTVVDADGTEASDLLYLDGDRYVERVEVNLIELPVTVSDEAGNAIADLGRDDFQVFEDGEPQKVETFGFSTNLPLSVGVLVDHSGSMERRIEEARQAALEFFARILRPDDRAFFGGFAFSADAITPFVANLSALRHEILDLPGAEGGTALYDAIVTGLYRFRAVEGRKALIVVTDGEDTASRVAYEDMLRYVRAARVPIYFIGIGFSKLDFGLNGRLRSLASETGGVAYFVNEKELAKVYDELEAELRSQYILGYYTESTKQNRDYRTIEVRVNRDGAKVRTIRGFIP